MAPDRPRFAARYRLGDAVHYGVRERDAWVRHSAAPWLGGVPTGEREDADAVTLLAPVLPGKIVCVGLNYSAHIAESLSVVPGAETPREPVIFLKPPSAVIGPLEPIVYPAGVTRLDPEAELGVVIGRRARSVEASRAMEYVAGLVAFNDVSARNYQKQDGQWTRAKGFDTFAPLGPWVAMDLDPSGLWVECRVNGERRQRGHTSDLLFPVPELVRFVSAVMTLDPGDVIATGTPAGIAPVVVGDRIEVEVEGIGVLENSVEAPAPWGR